MKLIEERRGSERYLFTALLVVEFCWQITYAWRVFWNGMIVPAFDWARDRLFWRVVEKARSVLWTR